MGTSARRRPGRPNTALQRRDLDGVAQRRAGAVRLDIADSPGESPAMARASRSTAFLALLWEGASNRPCRAPSLLTAPSLITP